MKKLAVLSLCLFIAGCATHSDIVPIGPDTFMISRGDAPGFFSNSDSLQADALKEANQYCKSQNKDIRVVDTTESSPPYIMGNFPRIEIQFMCLDKTED